MTRRLGGGSRLEMIAYVGDRDDGGAPACSEGRGPTKGLHLCLGGGRGSAQVQEEEAKCGRHFPGSASIIDTDISGW